MQNDAGDNVDLYIPRKCSWTNRLITSQDKGSVQINIGHVDPRTGMYTGKFTPFALSGYIRSKGEGDVALTTLASKMPAESS
ncbi:40S ribosomal protein S21 [Durusdinium trenchii]|uniref:40S ribosomal protein S21 n=1 Tax=Durusdinium trenchii TaxID=1381693 RepID=A0ABP0QXP4_9DINO